MENLFSYVNKHLTKVVKTKTILHKHTNTYQSSADQLILAKTKARDYALDTRRAAMREIMRKIDLNSHIRTDVLVPILKEAISGRKVVTRKIFQMFL